MDELPLEVVPGFPGLVVAEDLESPLELYELLGRAFVARLLVGVLFQGQLPVPLKLETVREVGNGSYGRALDRQS